MLHNVSNRSAKALVKLDGICTTATMPGQVLGKADKTLIKALVPPVEVP